MTMMRIITPLAFVLCVQGQTPSPSGSSLPSSTPSDVPSFGRKSELPSLEPTFIEDQDRGVSGSQADSTACPAVRNGGCSICGEGSCVTKPEALFAFPGQPEVECGALEDAGENGQVPLEQCPFLPSLIGTLCGCATSLPTVPVAPSSSPVESTPAPVEPTEAPIVTTLPPAGPTPCPLIPDGGCSICGTGLCVTIPEAIFRFDGQPEVECSVLEDAGENGEIPLNQCPFLPSMIVDLCGCQSAIPGLPTLAPSPAPITSAPVTPAPVTPAPVTPAPVSSAPVSSAPVSSAPVSSAPVSTAPVSTAPVIPTPMTSAPIIPAPVESPISPPVAPEPASVPVTPEPVAPVSQITPSPVGTSTSKGVKSMKTPKASTTKVAMDMIKQKDRRSRTLSTRTVRGA